MQILRWTYKLALVACCMLQLTACLEDGVETIVIENATLKDPDKTDEDNKPGEDEKPGEGDKPGEDDKPGTTEQDKTVVVGSGESATIERVGFKLIVPNGAVPMTSTGEHGKVAFSMQYVQPDNLPVPLPYGARQIGDASVKIEPMNFVFYSPLILCSPTQQQPDATLLHYNDYTEKWEVMPFSRRNADGSTDAALITLGYFVLVQYPYADQQLGGVRMRKPYLDDAYYYYLTLTPVDGNANDQRRISFAAKGDDLYMSNVPKGTYAVTISRERRQSWEYPSEQMDYCTTHNVTVANSLVAEGDDFADYVGWTDIDFTNGKWSVGRTMDWSLMTTSYGTGKFQVTLSWVNASSNAYTDYDLHLYGPDGIHIYYDQKTAGNLALDRDCVKEPGYAIENLFSVNDNFAPGEYIIKVQHYGGLTGKRFNCRIILGGQVVKSISGEITEDLGVQEIYRFTL